MARDRASIRINMWADEDWRGLSMPAQHLYMLILSHPTLSYAGVADWRPPRLASLSSSTTAVTVTDAATELQQHHFILVDEETEEVLIRSFIKHDGLLKQPKLAVSMANAFAGVASRKLREVIAFEVQKLHGREPALSAWESSQVQTILAAKATGIDAFTPPLTPAVTPPLTPNDGQELAEPTTTGTTTATNSSSEGETKKKGETRLAADWVPTAAHYERAKTKHIDIAEQVEAFRLHAETYDRLCVNWNSAFTTWLIKARPTQKGSGSDWALRM